MRVAWSGVVGNLGRIENQTAKSAVTGVLAAIRTAELNVACGRVAVSRHGFSAKPVSLVRMGPEVDPGLGSLTIQ